MDAQKNAHKALEIATLVCGLKVNRKKSKRDVKVPEALRRPPRVIDLFYNYPFQVGRFQLLFLAADSMGIRRPTVLITEFGWEYVSLPEPAVAMSQMTAVMELYAKYPEVKGAAIWYLGGGYSNIPTKASALFQPLTHQSITSYYERPTYPPIDPAIFLDYWEKEGVEP